MKVVILAGGLGTRLSEETVTRPKPMLEIGNKPILWHIMKIFSSYGLNDFVICLGYKGYMIKEYFTNYLYHVSDITIDMANNTTEIHHSKTEPWRVTLVDTGLDTNTAGRLKRVADYLDEEDFCLTYGDGVANVDIDRLLKFHRTHETLATVTAVQPPGRFGALKIQSNRVTKFVEKPQGDGGWINGGFLVCSPKVIDLIAGEQDSLEQDLLMKLASQGQLSAYKHDGFWLPMDTLRDKTMLNSLWESGEAPWRVWQ